MWIKVAEMVAELVQLYWVDQTKQMLVWMSSKLIEDIEVMEINIWDYLYENFNI